MIILFEIKNVLQPFPCFKLSTIWQMNKFMGRQFIFSPLLINAGLFLVKQSLERFVPYFKNYFQHGNKAARSTLILSILKTFVYLKYLSCNGSIFNKLWYCKQTAWSCWNDHGLRELLVKSFFGIKYLKNDFKRSDHNPRYGNLFWSSGDSWLKSLRLRPFHYFSPV